MGRHIIYRLFGIIPKSVSKTPCPPNKSYKIFMEAMKLDGTNCSGRNSTDETRNISYKIPYTNKYDIFQK